MPIIKGVFFGKNRVQLIILNNAYTTHLSEMRREGRKFDRRAIFMAFRYKDMAKGVLGLNFNGISKQNSVFD